MHQDKDITQCVSNIVWWTLSYHQKGKWPECVINHRPAFFPSMSSSNPLSLSSLIRSFSLPFSFSFILSLSLISLQEKIQKGDRYHKVSTMSQSYLLMFMIFIYLQLLSRSLRFWRSLRSGQVNNTQLKRKDMKKGDQERWPGGGMWSKKITFSKKEGKS